MRELVTCHRRRAGINALAPRERALNLNTVTHRFVDSHFQGIVEGVPSIPQCVDAAIVWVDFRLTSCNREKESLRSLRGQHDIRIIGPDWLVHTSRTYVTDRSRQVSNQFTLHI